MIPGRRTSARLTAVAVAALTTLCAAMFVPAQPVFAAAFAPIAGSGSSWSYPAIHAWITGVAQIGLPVNYTPNGSTTGRQQFAQGVVDFAASEIPYGMRDGNNFDPPPNRGYAYIPDTAGGTTFMYNLTIGGQRVTNLRLSGAVVAGIFTNTITMWDDPKIAADNPGLKLPAIRIVPVVRTDGSGDTAQFTQWMIATEGSYWTAYCQVVGRTPCTQTSAYPVQPGTAMIGQPFDTGVAAYVSQAQANGAIGYLPYSAARATGFPVAKVLNAAGYYTEPTAGHVGVSLLEAQINMNPSDPLYLSEDLSRVYTDTDPRTYELSSYSYMIVPTDASFGLTTDKGYTLGTFGQYLLCQGQQQVDSLGYSALPINLVEAGFAQLQKIPGAQVPTTTTAILAGCNNPTFSPDGTNTLADTDPQPQACDQQGPTQCTSGTGNALSTMTTLAGSPNPATVGVTVTLTATELASDNTHPAGSVQFMAGTSAIGTPVAVSATGTATTTTTFASAGTQSLSAVFTPTSTTYTASTGTFSEIVNSTGGGPIEPLAVTVPASGSFTLTVATGTVNLAVSGTSATGALNPITVADTRNTAPGWSVSGQSADFTGSGTAAGGSMSGNQLGWMPIFEPVPAGVTIATGVTLGGPVTPASSGLGTTAAILAQAHAGSGIGTGGLGANLTLAIPAAALAGPYASSLTLTAVTALP